MTSQVKNNCFTPQVNIAGNLAMRWKKSKERGSLQINQWKNWLTIFIGMTFPTTIRLQFSNGIEL